MRIDETQERFERRTYKVRVSQALSEQANLIGEMQRTKKQFSSEEAFKKGVVDKLNEISRIHGVPEYFSHNGFGGKYCSVMCTHCKHKALIWFTYSGDADGPFAIKFFRPPYGMLMHREVETHATAAHFTRGQGKGKSQ